jgi:hypothetical protein
MFMVDEHYQIQQKTSQFFAAQIMTQEWAEPKDAEHRLYTASSDVKDAAGHILVTAYPLERPDGQWAVLLVNKNHDRPQQVHLIFHNGKQGQDNFFAGPVTMITFGSAQYQWHPDRRKGHADPDNPPATTVLPGGDVIYTLPAASVTVLRGRLAKR